jgi:hypothetical protein
MTTSGRALACLIVLHTLTPRAASAFQWEGRIGLSYNRQETWTNAVHSTAPRLDVDLGLVAAGSIVAPSVLAWRGAVRYGHTRNEAPAAGGAFESNVLTYRLQSDLFSGQASPLRLSLGAERTEVDFSSSTDPDALGSRLIQSFHARAIVPGRTRPPLTLGYAYQDLAEAIPGHPDHDSTRHNVRAETRHGAGPYALGVSYDGEFKDGTWVSDQYTLHSAQVDARADLQQGTTFAITDSYSERKATTSAPGSYGLTSNLFSALARHGLLSVNDFHALRYQYSRGLATAPGIPTSERTFQTVQYENAIPFRNPEYFVQGLVAASLGLERQGATEIRSQGETAGLELWFRRRSGQSLTELRAGPLVGATQTPAGDLRGYGGSGGLQLMHPWGSLSVSGNYDVRYEHNLFGAPGTHLRHTAFGAVSGGLGTGRFSLQITAGGVRTATPLTGTRASRNVSTLGVLDWRKFALRAQFSLTEGMLGTRTGEFVGDGLVLPAPFDTRSTSASLGASGSIAALRADLAVRYSSVDAPGQPTGETGEVLGTISYAYGALTFSIEDRLTQYDFSGGARSTRQNLLMARVQRTFGSRY